MEESLVQSFMGTKKQAGVDYIQVVFDTRPLCCLAAMDALDARHGPVVMSRARRRGEEGKDGCDPAEYHGGREIRGGGGVCYPGE